jgi:hypothetical protein
MHMRRTVLPLFVLAAFVLLASPPASSVDIIVSGSGAVVGGHTIQEEGASLPAQPILNFTGPGITCTNSVPTTATVCNVPGGGGAGDITAVGSCATGDCFTPGVPSTSLVFGVVAAPPTPSLNTGIVYVDATSKNLAVKDDGNVVKHGVQTFTPLTNQFLTGVNDAGLYAAAQPSLGTLSDSSTVATKTGVQELTSTRLTPRIYAAPSSSPVSFSADTYDQVDITDLTTSPTVISIPTGTPKNGQLLLFSFYTTAKRTLTWTAGTGGFAEENGIPLPAHTLVATYAEVQLRYNTFSARWSPIVNSRSTPGGVVAYSEPTVTVNVDTTKFAYVASVTGPLTIANPTGTPQIGQLLRLSLCATGSYALTFGSEFRAGYGLLMPTLTSPTPSCDLFGFQRSTDNLRWDVISTSQGGITANRRTCMMVTGSTKAGAPTLADGDLGPETDDCMLPSAATIEEITIRASGGTPSVIVHRRTSAGVSTPLLSGALPTAAAGGLACARATAVAGYAGVTCAATLINPAVGAGDWIGLTSGTASTATKVSVAVSYLLTN